MKAEMATKSHENAQEFKVHPFRDFARLLVANQTPPILRLTPESIQRVIRQPDLRPRIR